MTDQLLNELRKFKKEGIYPFSKDLLPEMSDTINDLKSLNIIKHKNNSPTLEIIDLISFEKIIELKSLTEFKEWYSNKDRSITNNFNNSTVGQINQSSEKMNFKGPIKQKTVHKSAKELNTNSWIEISAWIIGIIVGILAIYEFAIKN